MLSRHCSRWLFQLTKRNSNRNFSTYYWFWKEEKKTLNSRDKNSINFLIFQFQYSSFVSRCWLLLNILFCFGCIAWFLNIQQANKDTTYWKEEFSVLWYSSMHQNIGILWYNTRRRLRWTNPLICHWLIWSHDHNIHPLTQDYNIESFPSISSPTVIYTFVADIAGKILCRRRRTPPSSSTSPFHQ